MQDSTVTRAVRAYQLAAFGCAVTALLAFSIPVNASGSRPGSGSTGTASLSWTAPTTNTNGSALTNLAGYHIYYGRSPSSMTTAVTVANPAATSYRIGNLPRGTWYFAMEAYTTGGMDSALSNTGSKSVR